MKSKYVISSIIICLFLMIGFVNTCIGDSSYSNVEDTSVQNTNLETQLKNALQAKLGKEFTYFEIGKEFAYFDNRYYLYYIKTDDNNSIVNTMSKRDIDGYIGVCSVKSVKDKQHNEHIILQELSPLYFIYKNQVGIIPAGIYDSKNNVYAIGTKVIQFTDELPHTGEKVITANGDDANTNIIKQIRLEVSNGTLISTDVDKYGYAMFLLIPKQEIENNVGSYYNDIKSFEGIDEQGEIVTKLNYGSK